MCLCSFCWSKLCWFVVFRPQLFIRRRRNSNPSTKPGKVSCPTCLILPVEAQVVISELMLMSCHPQEASPQRRSSSTLTGSVPVTLCVRLSTGCQVGTKDSSQLCCSWSSSSQLTHLFSPGDPRRPYPTDLEMRSGMLGHMANLPTNGVNGHLPGDALAAGRLPGESSHRCTVINRSTLSLTYRLVVCVCESAFRQSLIRVSTRAVAFYSKFEYSFESEGESSYSDVMTYFNSKCTQQISATDRLK